MSEDPKPGNGNVPPKLTLRKEDTGALPVPPPAAGAGSPPPAKKSTTRIPLAAVESGLPAEGAATPPVNYSTKTIRLTPLSASRPLSVAPAVRPSPTTSLAEMAKRQTSRIPLEAAMAADHAAPGGDVVTAPDTPKNIRIKRPGQAAAPTVATVKVAAPGAEPAPPADAAAGKAKTSRVDISDLQSEEAGQATQRKTIKIRRADGTTARPAPHSMTVARIEAEVAEKTAGAAEVTVRVNVVFPIMAAVALVVLGILVVVLAAQAFPSLGWRLPGTVTL